MRSGEHALWEAHLERVRIEHRKRSRSVMVTLRLSMTRMVEEMRRFGAQVGQVARAIEASRFVPEPEDQRGILQLPMQLPPPDPRPTRQQELEAAVRQVAEVMQRHGRGGAR